MLREQLDEDLKAALRQHDALRLSLIRQVKAGVLAQETRGRRTTLEDPDILAVIAKEIKEREEVIGDLERAGRGDLIDKARSEIGILETYLPPKLREDELVAMVDAAVREAGAEGPRDMGRVMAVLAPKTKGRADGRTVSDLVRSRLSR